ncbi:MAG: UbiX family flavin prenyltransferase [Bacteroidia bacterium]|nr:UbiX family flavin prenyltransferase [Bacteroidia bacterium]MCZ2247307.1 UbiX family flavin prenyltransferase [Bacteroidia bacterium]
MSNKSNKIVVAVTGASGAIYAQVLLQKLVLLQDQIQHIGVVMSHNAKEVWQYELGNNDFEKLPFTLYRKDDFYAPFASGSAGYNMMIVCPCSMGTLARIASGVSNDLTTRAADVMLKERKKLILVVRDTPYSLIHINNMKTITEAGGIICPASPSFYSRPKSFEELASTVVDRVLELSGLNISTYRWGEK